MLLADSELPPIDAAHCVSYDQHLFSREHLIEPAIEHPIRDDLDAELLGKFALEASGRVLAAFQSTARQLPLVPFIQKKHDAVVLQEDTLHRHR